MVAADLAFGFKHETLDFVSIDRSVLSQSLSRMRYKVRQERVTER
jgi:hypothetical protein